MINAISEVNSRRSWKITPSKAQGPIPVVCLSAFILPTWLRLQHSWVPPDHLMPSEKPCLGSGLSVQSFHFLEITKHLRLKGTNKDHQVQLLAPCRTTQELCFLRTPTKLCSKTVFNLPGCLKKPLIFTLKTVAKLCTFSRWRFLASLFHWLYIRKQHNGWALLAGSQLKQSPFQTCLYLSSVRISLI